MLVSILCVYRRVSRALTALLLQNETVFGTPAIGVARAGLRLAMLANVNLFGSPQIGFARKSIAASTLQNPNLFGSLQVEALSTRTQHLCPSCFANAQGFGRPLARVARRHLAQARFENQEAFGGPSLRVAKRPLQQSRIVNVTSFGASTSLVRPEKSFSYANALGTGDRRGSITVTASGGSASGTVSNLVDGTTSGNPFFSGAVTFNFDFGIPKVIKQARWKQTNATTHGLYKWQGSNDGSAYTDIGPAFTLGGATVNIHHTLIANETAYRYYRLTPTTGSMSGSPDIQEVEFYIEGATRDQPDTSYLYPCGGGVTAGGQSAGTGGNGTSRASLIAITASFTPPDGVLPNLVNGQATNNSSGSTDFASGLTNVVITFDFQPSGKKQVISGITWEQSNSTDQGTYNWEASDDSVTWTVLRSNFSLVNGSSSNETTWSSTRPYRYHRLRQVGGSTSSSPWIHEIYFKCAPGAYAEDSI